MHDHDRGQKHGALFSQVVQRPPHPSVPERKIRKKGPQAAETTLRRTPRGPGTTRPARPPACHVQSFGSDINTVT